ncbi:MAG: FAD-binding oxidoreductase [Tannerella sp.]|jgi:D-lactate dehydrogenase|nr:FAD-binding oxidoreductase [Tannerella sp.]
MQQQYAHFIDDLRSFMPEKRVVTGELDRLAWGTDASFYRLIPQIVVFPETENEVCYILKTASRYGIPLTFRASGTSLSGQVVTDSVLIVASHKWNAFSYDTDNKTVTVQPGIVGGRVNQLLKPFGRKISPDPASLNSAGIGGIIINNASGMSCGVHANSDKTVKSLKIIFADGTVLDTGNDASRKEFERQRPDFLHHIKELRQRIHDNPALEERIRYKYGIKNVTGLNLLPLAVCDDPFEIITRLMVGSEGTLGFISQATLTTERIMPFSASAMTYFNDLKTACKAVSALKKLTDNEGYRTVVAAELLDSKALASVDDNTGNGLTAVLLQTVADTDIALYAETAAITDVLSSFNTFRPTVFTSDEKECARLWQIRSGVFPAVGGSRPHGTTALIEDVAFHDEVMPDAIAELQQMLAAHGYTDACIYGHALDGNVHFILNQSFGNDDEISRYEHLMDEVVSLVVDKYDGSLKAEHGTGRNMAPFVEKEWGSEAFALMKEIKQLFDPDNLLNPGVIFNDDPKCHLKHPKPLPSTHPAVDKCIECGFCEINCLTCGFTLSSRQRIVVQREISRLTASGEDLRRLNLLISQYRYQGQQTCAADGLCAMSCPMNINTGDMTHAIRGLINPVGSIGYKSGQFVAKHLSLLKKLLRMVLRAASFGHSLFGTRLMSRLTGFMHRFLKIPLWTPAMPKARHAVKTQHATSLPDKYPSTVVYFPSCINQTMGLNKYSSENQPLIEATVALFNKGGYRVVFPENLESLCCGMIWESKGLEKQADDKAAELEAALRKASCNGVYPIVCDQSPCLYRMRRNIKGLLLYEPTEFISLYLSDRLKFSRLKETVSIHVTCSMRKMGLADTLYKLASMCAENVIMPDDVGCCGFAGDKGFTHPEVNEYALRNLHKHIATNSVTVGYCNSRTCEIGLTTHSGIDYRSIVYLVDRATE